MQAIVRRSMRARASSKRKWELEKKAIAKQQRREAFEDRRDHIQKRKHIERRNYKRTIEDWKLGPLAPKRNYAGLSYNYGAVERRKTQMPEIARETDVEASLSYDKYTARCFYRPEDRVVILKGPERGKIGRVMTVDEASGSLKLKDLNKIYTYLRQSEAKWLKEMETPRGGSMAADYLPFSDVRLVTTMPDGQEVIVDKMLVIKERHRTGIDLIRRFIPGTMHDIDAGCDIEPEEPNRKPPGKEPYYEPVDTFQMNVRPNTWTPSITLDQEPFPGTIIDELRNKYSKYRVRHEDAFIEKMIALDEKKELKAKAGRLMLRTPRKEYGRQQRLAAKEVAQQKTLSEGSLSLIGEYMARNLRISAQNQLGSSSPSRPPAP